PHYARSLNNLAVLYLEIGQRRKPLPLLLEACELDCQVVGERHPDSASSLNNLAGLYKARGEHGKALPLYLEARQLLRKVGGEEHPLDATSLINLARLHQEMGEPGKAQAQGVVGCLRGMREAQENGSCPGEREAGPEPAGGNSHVLPSPSR